MNSKEAFTRKSTDKLVKSLSKVIEYFEERLKNLTETFEEVLKKTRREKWGRNLEIVSTFFH